MDCRFPKEERLHSKKSIKELFDKGSSFFLYPFKVFYLPNPHTETNQVLISVSKKRIKKAVDRNLIKRRIREAYRLNKHLLSSQNENKKLIGLVYVSSDLMGFASIEPQLQKILRRISAL
ncbi:ribonuclease P protein component [Negadavirga shengliensis]|uniref:Ribonuclease P protein component n=1 Tax=Negadavirga shengliensis TaxID=1389218 RepID=A0ABV9SWQ7_9BACT